MTSSDLDRIRERIEQNRMTQTGAQPEIVANSRAAACRMGCTFFAGEYVLDLPTGLGGTVTDAMRMNVISSAPRSTPSAADGGLATLPSSEIVESVSVRLSDGRVVTRVARELVKRPTPPGAVTR